VGNVGLSTPAAPPPSAPAQPTITPIATAPMVVPAPPPPPPLVPPQTHPSRLERCERDGRLLSSPAPPPSPTPEELERAKLLRALVARNWSDDEARILEAGRSADSLRLIGAMVEDTAVRVSAIPMEMVRGEIVKQVPGKATR